MENHGRKALADWYRVRALRTGGRLLCLAEPNETVAGIVAHKSVRRFLDKPLGEGMLELLVLAAQSASTSGNMQNWSVVSITDPAVKSKFMNAGYNNRAIEQAPVYLVWMADVTHMADQLPSANLDSLEYLETFLMASVDAAMAAQTFAIAAQSLGLGTVFHGSIRATPEIATSALDLPKYVFPVFAMAVGWPSEERTAHQPDEIKPRLPQHLVLHREKYQPRDVAAWDDYDKLVDRFHREHTTSPANYAKLKLWSAANISRLTKSLNKKLVATLAKAGFGVR